MPIDFMGEQQSGWGALRHRRYTRVGQDEMQSALKAIRVGGINVVAIHSHMTHEQPRILFFHYWGRGPAKELAEAIQGALLAAGLSGVSTTAVR